MKVLSKKQLLLFMIIVIILIVTFIFIRNTELLVDEKPHFAQIKVFSEGNTNINPDLTTIPGYHVLSAVIASVFSLTTISSIRLITLLYSLLFVFSAILVLNKVNKKTSKIKLLQIVFLPIIFPFLFLIYTDILSATLVLLTVYLMLNKKYTFAGLVDILSILIRQNNIIWLAFLAIYIYYENFGIKFNLEILRNALKKLWVFVAGFIGFIIFIIWNKGITMGDNLMHPSFSLHTGNIFFMLFIFFFLFLPMNIANFQKVLKIIKKKKTIIISLLLFVIYLITFVNNHPYNIQWGEYFLRNRILIYFTSTIYLKILFFIPILYSVLSLSVTKLQKKSHYLIYLFSLLYLIPHWLIEQRYYIIPFMLFIIFKRNNTKWIEYITIIIYILTAYILGYFIQNLDLFL